MMTSTDAYYDGAGAGGGSDSPPDGSGNFTGEYDSRVFVLSDKKYVYELKQNGRRQYTTTDDTQIETTGFSTDSGILVFPNAGLVYVDPDIVRQSDGSRQVQVNGLKYRLVKNLSPQKAKEVAILKNKEKAHVDNHINQLVSLASLRDYSNKLVQTVENPEQIDNAISSVFKGFNDIDEIMSAIDDNRKALIDDISSFKQGIAEGISGEQGTSDLGTGVAEPPDSGSPQTVSTKPTEAELSIGGRDAEILPPDGHGGRDEEENGGTNGGGRNGDTDGGDEGDQGIPSEISKTIGVHIGTMIKDIEDLRDMMPDQFSEDFDEILQELNNIPQFLDEILTGPDFNNIPDAIQGTLMGEYNDLSALLSESVIGTMSNDVDDMLSKIDTTNATIATMADRVSDIDDTVGDISFEELQSMLQEMNSSLDTIESTIQSGQQIGSIWDKLSKFLGLEARAIDDPKDHIEQVKVESNKMSNNIERFKRIAAQRAVEAEQELNKLEELDPSKARKHVAKEPIMDVQTGQDVVDRLKSLSHAIKSRKYPTLDVMKTTNKMLTEASDHMDGNKVRRSDLLKNMNGVRTDMSQDEDWDDWMIEISDEMRWWEDT